MECGGRLLRNWVCEKKLERFVSEIGLDEGEWDNLGWKSIQEDLFLPSGRYEAIWLERA